ncbi:hypothetical protein R1flu_022515 [Riccia fluitans]|uniref:Peroxidase n=1 Tax=Riccia fluitans TaxID=41844 RepID=A0ABD1XPE9_9MARC
MVKAVVAWFAVAALLLQGTLATQFSTELRSDYYDLSCPELQSTVARTSWYKYNNSRVVAAGVLRIFFHDCWVTGCDASLMLMSTPGNEAEKDAQENLSISGDGLDAVTQAKLAVEEICPGVVSCADLITLVARELIILAGGPRYQLFYGRLDGRTSRAEDAVAFLPRARDSMDQLIQNFANQSFSIREMVALLGGHTIGFAHCSEFDYRIYNYSSTVKVDPLMNSTAVETALGVCPIGVDVRIVGNLDNTTPEDFDNAYFQNLQQRGGVLESDQMLYEHPLTKPFVNMYAANNTLWYQDFVAAMEKMGTMNVRTAPGPDAEIRQDCAFINPRP